MNDDFFDRLEAELAGITYRGQHLPTSAGRNRRVSLRARRVAIAVFAVVILASSLISEFPATADGRPHTPTLTLSA